MCTRVLWARQRERDFNSMTSRIYFQAYLAGFFFNSAKFPVRVSFAVQFWGSFPVRGSFAGLYIYNNLKILETRRKCEIKLLLSLWSWAYAAFSQIWPEFKSASCFWWESGLFGATFATSYTDQLCWSPVRQYLSGLCRSILAHPGTDSWVRRKSKTGNFVNSYLPLGLRRSGNTKYCF